MCERHVQPPNLYVFGINAIVSIQTPVFISSQSRVRVYSFGPEEISEENSRFICLKCVDDCPEERKTGRQKDRETNVSRDRRHIATCAHLKQVREGEAQRERGMG